MPQRVGRDPGVHRNRSFDLSVGPPFVSGPLHAASASWRDNPNHDGVFFFFCFPWPFWHCLFELRLALKKERNSLHSNDHPRKESVAPPRFDFPSVKISPVVPCAAVAVPHTQSSYRIGTSCPFTFFFFSRPPPLEPDRLATSGVPGCRQTLSSPPPPLMPSGPPLHSSRENELRMERTFLLVSAPSLGRLFYSCFPPLDWPE